MRRFLTGCRIFNGDTLLSDQGIVIADGNVEGLASAAPADAVVEMLPADHLLAPGLLDLQINGAGGVLFNTTPTTQGALTIAATARRFGATGVLPTFITGPRAAMEQAIAAAVAAVANPGGGVLGIHIEGPFISPERRGIHDAQAIRQPDTADIDLLVEAAAALNRAGGRLLLTLAPERVDDRALGRLVAGGVVVAAGHTAATFERIEAALRQGVRGFTHLGNAMTPITNRAPGPVAAALASRDAWCGLIGDGCHIHPGLMRAFLAAKAGRVFLVTDAMPPLGTTATEFTLNGRSILRRGGCLVSTDGVLAGADIGMDRAVANAVTLAGQTLEEALRMATLYPATYLGLDHRLGRIAPGRSADFVLLGPDLATTATWMAGQRLDATALRLATPRLANPD